MSLGCKRGNGLAFKHCLLLRKPWASIPLSRYVRSYNSGPEDGARPAKDLQAMHDGQLREQLELDSVADALRRIFTGPGSLQRGRSNHQRLEQNQARPGDWTETIERPNLFRRLRHFEDENKPSVVLSLDLLRFQYRACSMPEDYVLVYATAFRHRESAQLIASQSMQSMLRGSLTALLNKSRPHYKGTDTADRVLMAVDHFVRRARSRGFEVESSLLLLGLRSAVDCQSPSAIKRYLKLWQTLIGRVRQTPLKSVPPRFFIDLVAGLSSKREDSLLGSPEQVRKAMLEIMCGFSDAPSAQPYHLGIHLPRDSAPVLTKWLSALAVWKGGEQIWAEWIRIQPPLGAASKRDFQTHESDRLLSEMTPKFIMCLFQADDPVRAWRVFADASQFVHQHDYEIWSKLFIHAAFMPRLEHKLYERVKAEFIRKLDRELRTLEGNLGLRWIEPGNGQQPYHDLGSVVSHPRGVLWAMELRQSPRNQPSQLLPLPRS